MRDFAHDIIDVIEEFYTFDSYIQRKNVKDRIEKILGRFRFACSQDQREGQYQGPPALNLWGDPV